jgi:hypothetical protein
MARRFLIMTMSIVFVVLSTCNSFADYTLLLNVPLYGQDTSYYCGAASSQMIMMGYPNAASRKCHVQDQIYGTIQAKKQDSGFYSDPDGLKDTVMSLNPPPAAGHFSIFSDASSGVVMHDMLYWMSIRNYPTAALINKGDHWVVITGFRTDVNPQSGNAVLQSIDINDPAPPDTAPHDNPCTAAIEGNEGGTIRHATGTSWFSNDWQNPNRWGTKWLNKYVAVVEPPAMKGSITAPQEVEKGEVISAEAALRLVAKHIKERKLIENRKFSFLNKAKATRALLINRNHKGYYLVPLEYQDRRCPGAILMNAYTGEFQEIGAFAHPLEYLTEEEAVNIAICSIRKKPEKRPVAELEYRASEQMKSRYRPVWKVTIVVGESELIRYVSQVGEVFTEITPVLLGGD